MTIRGLVHIRTRKKVTISNENRDPYEIRLEPDNIVLTKLVSEYCNAALSVVHELYTAQFQCSSPLFH